MFTVIFGGRCGRVCTGGWRRRFRSRVRGRHKRGKAPVGLQSHWHGGAAHRHRTLTVPRSSSAHWLGHHPRPHPRPWSTSNTCVASLTHSYCVCPPPPTPGPGPGCCCFVLGCAALVNVGVAGVGIGRQDCGDGWHLGSRPSDRPLAGGRCRHRCYRGSARSLLGGASHQFHAVK